MGIKFQKSATQFSYHTFQVTFSAVKKMVLLFPSHARFTVSLEFQWRTLHHNGPQCQCPVCAQNQPLDPCSAIIGQESWLNLGAQATVPLLKRI